MLHSSTMLMLSNLCEGFAPENVTTPSWSASAASKLRSIARMNSPFSSASPLSGSWLSSQPFKTFSKCDRKKVFYFTNNWLVIFTCGEASRSIGAKKIWWTRAILKSSKFSDKFTIWALWGHFGGHGPPGTQNFSDMFPICGH